MRLLEMSIKNYRNLDGLYLRFLPTVNFIVGENSVGKSNILDLIKTVFTCNFFDESDFLDFEKPIQVNFALMDDNEGVRYDITATQENNGENYILFTDAKTGEKIPHSFIKLIHYIGFDSFKNPTNRVKIENISAINMFIQYLITSQLNKDKIKDRSSRRGLSNMLKKLKPFTDSLSLDDDIDISVIEDLLDSIKLSENVITDKSLQSVPFASKIVLSILEEIIKATQRKNDLEKGSEFSTLLVLDEPEIHIHPYMQRTLIKDVLSITENKNEFVQMTLKELYGIDKIDGQIVIVTHSSNIILNNYKEIIRIFKSGNTIKAINGAALQLSAQNRKHLMMQFTFVKEAMFSRCVIIVEGETEYGSMVEFGRKMGVDFDRYGIAIIKSSGAGSIVPLMNLFESFNIPTLGIMDRDIKDMQSGIERRNLYFTKTTCFESEIIYSLAENDNEEAIHIILSHIEKDWENKVIYKATLNKIINKFKIDYPQIKENSLRFNKNLNKTLRIIIYLSILYTQKSIILGRVIAENMAPEDIPESYRDIILKAVKYCGKDI